MEMGEGGGEGYSIYLRGTDGSPAVRLGPGNDPTFSPDGKWVLAGDIRSDPPQLVLLPTGPGEPVPVTRDRLQHVNGRFLPDGKRVVFAAGEPARGWRLYVQTIPVGHRRRSPRQESGALPKDSGPVSPDGRFVAAWSPVGKLHIYPTSPGDSLPVSGVEDGEFPIQWSPDGKSLYVKRTGELPARVFRVNPFSGK